jgi:hypothetical protein
MWRCAPLHCARLRAQSFSCPRQALKSGDYAEANRLKDVIEGEKRAEKALRERASKQRLAA